MKSKKQNVLAIRNDIKGVVFFKVTSEVDVYATFDRLVFAVKEKVWKPKYVSSYTIFSFLFLDIFEGCCQYKQ